MRRPVSLLLLSVLCVAPAAQAGATPDLQAADSLGSEAAAQALERPQIARLARLPVQGVQVVETVQGDLLFVSSNGRYVFRGTAYDIWNTTKVHSYDQAVALANRIDLRKLGLDVADLGALDKGVGADVVAFVDPLCEHCAALFASLDALAGRYRFRLVPIPALGEVSERAVVALDCASAKNPTAALTALLGHSTSSLPQPTGSCGRGQAQRALVAAQVIGVGGTPFLIAPDGRMHQGRPADLETWLAGEGARAQ